MHPLQATLKGKVALPGCSSQTRPLGAPGSPPPSRPQGLAPVAGVRPVQRREEEQAQRPGHRGERQQGAAQAARLGQVFGGVGPHSCRTTEPKLVAGQPAHQGSRTGGHRALKAPAVRKRVLHTCQQEGRLLMEACTRAHAAAPQPHAAEVPSGMAMAAVLLSPVECKDQVAQVGRHNLTEHRIVTRCGAVAEGEGVGARRYNRLGLQPRLSQAHSPVAAQVMLSPMTTKTNAYSTAAPADALSGRPCACRGGHTGMQRRGQDGQGCRREAAGGTCCKPTCSHSGAHLEQQHRERHAHPDRDLAHSDPAVAGPPLRRPVAKHAAQQAACAVKGHHFKLACHHVSRSAFQSGPSKQAHGTRGRRQGVAGAQRGSCGGTPPAALAPRNSARSREATQSCMPSSWRYRVRNTRASHGVVPTMPCGRAGHPCRVGWMGDQMSHGDALHKMGSR